MRRLLGSLSLAVLVSLLTPATGHAQQSVNLYVGGFVPRAEDARDANDVLVQDRSFLDFDMSHLNGGTVGGEWLVGLGDFFDAGLGLGFYQGSTLAADRFSVFDDTGEPVVANLKLRTVPFTATVRFLPLGHHAPIQPYIGGGVTAIRWRYSESGDFVSTDGDTIIHGNFVGTGSASGPVVLGGVRFPFGPAAIGGEIRWQSAKGDLPASEGFAGSTIDLGGFNYLATFNIRF